MKSADKFFISCPIGFEEELQNEMHEIYPFLIANDGRPQTEGFEILEVDKGGIEIKAQYETAVQLNFFLKTANRILWRLETRKIKEVPELKKFFKSLKLNELTNRKNFQLEVSCQKSKINNEKKVTEVFSEIFNVKKEAESTTVYVRFFQDLCTFSLDTTGEHLHFRSLNKEIGEAPLRETIAAFCIRKMLSDISFTKWPEITWVDPVVGSGTFLTEARDLYSPNKTRSFPFQGWKKTAKIFASEAFMANYKISPSCFKAFCGYDIDEKMLNTVKKNWGAQQSLYLENQDLFVSNNFTEKSKPVFVVMNPPYGDRIKTDRQGIDFVNQAVSKFKPQRLGVLLPVNQTKEIKMKFKNHKAYAVNHGGLHTEFLIIEPT